MCHVLRDEYRGRVSCVMLYTTSIVVVECHVVDDECNGGRVSSCTRRV